MKDLEKKIKEQCNAEIILPTFEEQRKIASVLIAIDDEIRNLKSKLKVLQQRVGSVLTAVNSETDKLTGKLETLQQKKQNLMQQLTTNRYVGE